MPTKSSEKEEMLNALSKRIFSAMLDELIFDVAIEAHHEVMKGKALCSICHTRCGSGNGGSTSKDGNVLLDLLTGELWGLDCVNSICTAFGAMYGVPSDATRSASPASEAGNGSDERVNGKGKDKGKSKVSEENEGSLKRKRTQSPQTSPAKTKKAKASGSPVSRVKAAPDSTAPHKSHYTPSAAGTKTKIPSKLRESSTTSFLDRSPTTSRSTSPAATPASSAFSGATQSPQISSRSINSHSQQSNGHVGGNNGRGRGKVTGTGPPPRRPAMSPPRPPPPPPPRHSVVDHYGMHDGGDETGSSTDTDSD
ncbi:hypothetical protein NP233_g5357 [Leucocoprinus birnbaumii]|uniref:Uncharacterized protein n=1 Tax=Leucocoprinus birnbaumii TaxID=56174 RepID=A0AAD5VT14_9AGAR|nr:hypothetical protein NP233_g5357 [Leucocoprinus birnbaumii]